MTICPLYTIEDTKNCAISLAENAKVTDVFLLEGDLGLGKTTFARFFIQHLCGSHTIVPSPTFTLVQTYDSPKGIIYHYDLYRLENYEEVYELGIEESFYYGICLVEWPERVSSLKIPHARTLKFYLEGNTRFLKI